MSQEERSGGVSGAGRVCSALLSQGPQAPSSPPARRTGAAVPSPQDCRDGRKRHVPVVVARSVTRPSAHTG